MGTVHGERHPKAKITEAQAIEVRRRAVAGESNKLLSQEYGIAGPTVSAIKTGATWKHLPGETSTAKIVRRGSEHWITKFDEAAALEILRLRHEKKQRVIDIAAQFNVSAGTVSQITNGNRWRHVYDEYFGSQGSD